MGRRQEQGRARASTVTRPIADGPRRKVTVAAKIGWETVSVSLVLCAAMHHAAPGGVATSASARTLLDNRTPRRQALARHSRV